MDSIEKLATITVGDNSENVEKMTEARFSKLCKKKWELRLATALRYRQMCKRTVSWAKAAQDIDDDQELQGESCKQRRTYLKGIAKQHLELIRTACFNYSEKEKEHIREGFQRLEDDADKVSKDVCYVPQLDEHEISSWMLQYCDDVSLKFLKENISIFSIYLTPYFVIKVIFKGVIKIDIPSF